MPAAARHRQFDKRDEELERLRRLVRDLEVEAKGKNWRVDRGNQEKRSNSEGNPYEAEFNHSGSRQCWARSPSRESRRR